MFDLKASFTIDQSRVKLSAAQPVRWSRCQVEVPVQPHDHEFTEICLVLGGSAVHVTEEGEEKLSTHRVLVVPPGCVHAFLRPSNLEVINIYFLSEWFLPEIRLESQHDGILPLFFAASLFARKEFRRVWQFSISTGDLERILYELQDIHSQENAEKADRMTVCCFFKALFLMARNAGVEASDNPTLQASPKIWTVLGEIDRIVSAGEKLDLVRLARSVGMTRDHLGRCFKAEVGETPKIFHQRRRLQLSCRMLLDQPLNLAEIAYKLGYADEAHFCRVFREEFAMTPKEYRRKFAGGIRNPEGKSSPPSA